MRHPKICLLIQLFLFVAFWLTSAVVVAQKKSVADTLYKTISASGLKAAIEQYHDLKSRQADDYDFSPGALNGLAYKLLGEGKGEPALAIFQLNVQVFPDNVNAYDSLGECYLSLGRNEPAIENYQKVLALLPDAKLNERAKQYFQQNAEAKLFQARNFEPVSANVLNYVVFYGGAPAGKWDMENLAQFKKEIKEPGISYHATNLYQTPVPFGVPKKFEAEHLADVTSSFIGGVYREFIQNGQIADISQLWQSEGWHEIFPASFKKMVTYKDKQYFVPQAFQFNPIWYRKDIFEKHNWQPPESWEELLQLCDRIHAAGYSPFTVSAQGWPPPVARWFSILNLRLNGAEFHEAVMQGKVPFTGSKIKNVFRHWAQLFEHNAFHDSTGWNNYAKGIRDIVSGKAVMYNLGEWIFESLSDSVGALLDFFPIPTLNENVASAEIVHAYGAFMLTDSRHPKAALNLLRHLGSKDSQENNVKILKRINPNKQIDQTLYSGVQKRLFAHVAKTDVLVPLFEFNTKAKLAQAGLAAFVKFWRSPQDAEDILEELEQTRLELAASW